MIYLDNAATTRVSPEAADALLHYSTEEFYNMGGSYGAAVAVKNAVEDARAYIAKTLGCAADELYFMSCATEANNFVLRRAVKSHKSKIVITAGEHASVYETANRLKSKYDLAVAPLTNEGRVDKERLFSLIDKSTALVSLIHVNNETGAINEIAEITRRIKRLNPDCLVHADGVQAYTKLPVNLKSLGVDFYTVSAHKVNGPKGVAALFIRKGISLNPLVSGGGQEDGRRSGTENVPGIMGFYNAVKYKRDMVVRLSEKRNQNVLLRNLLSEKIAGIKFHSGEDASPYIISFSLPYARAEVLSNILSEKGLIVGLGSACSQSKEINRVLSEMGVPKSEIEGNIRISLSDTTTDEEIISAADMIAGEMFRFGKR